MSLGNWVQEQLFERRIVLVTGRLDDEAAEKAAAALLTLDASGNQPIALHLDSPDGELGSAFVLIDTADTLRSALHIARCTWSKTNRYICVRTIPTTSRTPDNFR